MCKIKNYAVVWDSCFFVNSFLYGCRYHHAQGSPKVILGLSAYEFWKEKVADGTVNWPKDQTEVADFFKYLRGKDGKDGQDGQSAFEQWKEMIADGSVDNPHDPDKKWSPENNTIQDFWRFLTGASGEDGQTPHVGDNGNWFIGNEDTGIGARGRDGQNGADGKMARTVVMPCPRRSLSVITATGLLTV